MSRILGTIIGCDIIEDDDGRVHFTSHARVDSDGATGSKREDPDWQGDTSLHHADGTPLDAKTEKYIAVPPVIIQKTKGIVLGCKARVTWNGRSVDAVVADEGPASGLGELSVACAAALGMDTNPRNGGVDSFTVLFELWPGVPAPGYKLRPS